MGHAHDYKGVLPQVDGSFRRLAAPGWLPLGARLHAVHLQVQFFLRSDLFVSVLMARFVRGLTGDLKYNFNRKFSTHFARILLLQFQVRLRTQSAHCDQRHRYDAVWRS